MQKYPIQNRGRNRAAQHPRQMETKEGNRPRPSAQRGARFIPHPKRHRIQTHLGARRRTLQRQQPLTRTPGYHRPACQNSAALQLEGHQANHAEQHHRQDHGAAAGSQVQPHSATTTPPYTNLREWPETGGSASRSLKLTSGKPSTQSNKHQSQQWWQANYSIQIHGRPEPGSTSYTARDCKSSRPPQPAKCQSTWASPENPMKALLYKTTADSLKDLPRKVAMVRAKGTLDFAKGVS